MASAAEQLAANINFSALGKAEELKKRIWFTLGALIVVRLGTYIPLPGINPAEYAKIFSKLSQGFLGIFQMFSGGAMGRHAIFSLNIMPYISASIIIQLMTTVVPSLESLKKDGDAGRRIINQYTRYLTVVLALFQSYGIAYGLQAQGAAVDNGPFFLISSVITLTGGTLFLMWLGEQITSRGVGNGTSLIIFAGIVAELPAMVIGLLEQGRVDSTKALLVPVLLVGAILLVAFIVFMERAQRRILINYPKRQVGNRVSQAQSSFLPLKLNTAGVIPPIFASSLLLLPTTFLGFTTQNGGPEWLQSVNYYLGHGRPLFMLLYAALIIFFAFFYTAIVLNPQETADNLKKQGGFIPGIRPGERTAEFIDKILTRVTVLGALYITFVCLVPELASNFGASLAFGGTSILIIVSVTMDTVAQVHGYLMAHQYQGLVKKAKLKGSKRS
jgi:preprotein translocase subunit SecY